MQNTEECLKNIYESLAEIYLRKFFQNNVKVSEKEQRQMFQKYITNILNFCKKPEGYVKELVERLKYSESCIAYLTFPCNKLDNFDRVDYKEFDDDLYKDQLKEILEKMAIESSFKNFENTLLSLVSIIINKNITKFNKSKDKKTLFDEEVKKIKSKTIINVLSKLDSIKLIINNDENVITRNKTVLKLCFLCYCDSNMLENLKFLPINRVIDVLVQTDKIKLRRTESGLLEEFSTQKERISLTDEEIVLFLDIVSNDTKKLKQELRLKSILTNIQHYIRISKKSIEEKLKSEKTDLKSENIFIKNIDTQVIQTISIYKILYTDKYFEKLEEYLKKI